MAAKPASAEPRPSKHFWRAVVRFERQKVIPWIALRNTIGVGLPLAIGVLAGAPLSGVAIATGALNVSYSDGDDPYYQRAKRMLNSCLFTACAVFVGGLVGRHHVLATLVTALWALVAGVAVALGTTAADLGVISLVTLVVYAAQPLTPQNAAWAALLAIGGGVFQTGLAVIFWPVRRYEPERRALGHLYTELARVATDSVSSESAPPVSQRSTQAQQMLSSLGQDHRIEGERYRSLLNQAERIRLCLMTLSRLRRRLERENQSADAVALFTELGEVTSDVLYSVGLSLNANEPLDGVRDDLTKFNHIADKLRVTKRDNLSSFTLAMLEDAQLQADALGGQLRAVTDLAESATPSGIAAFEQREATKPTALRLRSGIAIIRANLTLTSTACRHAIRLSACLLIGDIIAQVFGGRRSYWLPMTIAIVLKPDFTGTFSRGVLRLAGTFTGLAIATLLFYFLQPSPLMQATLVTIFTYALRSIGPANYGIFVVSISAIIVFLVELTGVSAWQVIEARGINTAAGGVLALLVYWIWPTWEKTQVREAFARMVDAYREYFREIAETYKSGRPEGTSRLDSLRLEARLARSNAEASIDRLSAEPGVHPQELGLCVAMLASTHRLVHALMALDSGLARSNPVPAREAFKTFAKDVDVTLYLLSSALRGSSLLKKQLPDLREDHRRLLLSGDPKTERYALVNVETDRITNSINTFRDQVFHLLTGTAEEGAKGDDENAPALVGTAEQSGA
jgi:uncharacterized membrane protein YccC